MKIKKDDKYIEIDFVINDKYAFVDEIKNKVVYLNVRKKYDKDEVDRFIDRHFEHQYLTAIHKLWKEVINWIQNSEYEIASNYDFECYSEGDSNSDDYVSGIWVPLKLKKNNYVKRSGQKT